MIYRRNRVWWYGFSWRGKSIRCSSKSSSKRECQLMHDAHLHDLRFGIVGPEDSWPPPKTKTEAVPTLREFDS